MLRAQICNMLIGQITEPDGPFACTKRLDQWWLGPAATALGLVVFFGCLTFRAFNASYVCLVRPVHQPSGGSSGLHAGVRLLRVRTGGRRLVGRVPDMVASIPAPDAGDLYAVDGDCIPLYLLVLPRCVL